VGLTSLTTVPVKVLIAPVKEVERCLTKAPLAARLPEGKIPCLPRRPSPPRRVEPPPILFNLNGFDIIFNYF
jgi:hypothetical protein